MSGLAAGIALILDMDGVLVNSNPFHRRAWEEFNRRYGLETTEEMHERMYGKRNDRIIRDFFGEDLPEAEVSARGAAKEQLYPGTGRFKRAVLVPGVHQFLPRYSGELIGLPTNAEPANVNFLRDGAGLRRYFRVIVDGHQVSRPKPHPEVYFCTATEVRVAPRNCVVFEDSHSGVVAATAAGMRVVGVCTTHGYLQPTLLHIDNFCDGRLDEWLQAQSAEA